MLESRGDVEGAMRKHDEALKANPKDTSVLLSAGHLCERHGRHEQAANYYAQVLQQDLRNPAAHNDLGMCLARQGRLPEAAQEISTAIDLQPGNPTFRNNLALVCVELGDKAGALQQLTAANGPAVGHYNLGQLLFQRGDLAEARDLFERAVSLDPQLAPAQDMLARLGFVTQQASATQSSERGFEPARHESVPPSNDAQPVSRQLELQRQAFEPASR